jgi:hypothetical protein
VATDTESDTTSELDTETATAQASAVHQALKLLVHSVLASNEFVFIR